MPSRYTPTQRRILALLADGRPHPRQELLACLPDAELGSLATVRVHVCLLRRRLRASGEDILCVLHGSTLCYRQVRLLEAATGTAWDG